MEKSNRAPSISYDTLVNYQANCFIGDERRFVAGQRGVAFRGGHAEAL